MKKILNAKQLQTVMVLCAVIFILLCGVAYTVSTRQSTAANTTPVGTEKPPHSLVRDARVSANERLSWETNIGGQGDETPVAVFTKNNEIYIFGNTDSSDYDFAGLEAGKTRGFGARLSVSGRTLSFTVFDFTVFKAVPTLSGFAVAGNEGSVAGLFLLSDTLTVTGKAYMPATHVLSACGLYIFDNRYFLVAQSRNEITDVTTLLLHVYTSGLALEREKTFSHTYGLTLLDILPHNDGYLLAAAASFQERGHLTVARFTMLSEPAYTDYNLGYKYTPTAFIPLGTGFATVCDNEGACELLTLNAALVKTDVKFLTETPNRNSKTLFYAGAPYAYTGERLLQLSEDGRVTGSLDFTPECVTAFGTNAAAAFVAGIKDGTLTVALLGKEKSEVISLQSVQSSSLMLCAQPNSLLLCADTSGVTADCGNVFGGRDVWLGKILLS